RPGIPAQKAPARRQASKSTYFVTSSLSIQPGILVSAMSDVKSGVGGWLLGLCVVLLAWQPLTFALLAANALQRLALRGLSLALVLTLRLAVTALGIAAGLALMGRRPGAVALAKVSLTASLATDLFVYATPYFPNYRAPGETPLNAATSVAWYGLWLMYLF